MRIVIACNPFKESMSSIAAAAAVAEGFKSVFGRIGIDSVPIADGGDGTLDSVAACVPAERVFKRVEDPLGRKIRAEYLIADGGRTAVVEMAKASGLALLKLSERNPLKASTFGTGQLIRDALDRGVKKIVVGIGGSATNDGGTGMAAALGCRFLDAGGKRIKPSGGSIAALAKIDISGIHPRARDVELVVACDVTNPLTGPRSASVVYSPQKGATPSMVKALESNLSRLAETVERDLGIRAADYPGAGAAGGLGYGLMVFLGATLRPGFDLMADISKLEKKIRRADLVITGEGRMDAQSAQGKAPFGVLGLARKHCKPAIAFCGYVDGEDDLVKAGFSAVLPIVDRPMPLEDAIANGPELLRRAARRAALLIKTGKMKLC